MSDTTITYLVLGVVVAVFVWDHLPVAAVALGTALTLWATGVLTLDQSLAGFGDPTVIFIASLFVVSEALDATGITAWLGQALIDRAGDSRSRVIVFTLLLVAVLTALISVNGSVAALLPVVAVLVLRATLFYCVVEFAQLWLLALGTPTAQFGLANAVLLASLGIGGFLVSRLQLSRYLRMLIILGIILLAGIGLIIFRSTPAIVISQATFAAGLVCIAIIFNRILHDNLDSNIRAGASSAASTLGRLFIIPVALLFGYVSQKITIYKAAYIFLGLTAIMAWFVIIVARRNNRTGLHA